MTCYVQRVMYEISGNIDSLRDAPCVLVGGDLVVPNRKRRREDLRIMCTAKFTKWDSILKP